MFKTPITESYVRTKLNLEVSSFCPKKIAKVRLIVHKIKISKITK